MTSVKIKVTFVIPKHCSDENDCSEDMLIAYTACENHRGGGLEPQWTHENSIMISKPLTKNDIFVLTEFEGELYEKLRSTKCLVLGPRCLSCSLTEGNTIPSKGPVYSVAMRGLIITISGLAKELKLSLKQKIEWMGGTYSAVLSSETTHLIANNVFSDKYMKATERGIPVMRDAWVDAVWEASLKLDINGSSSDFNCHRLPPFANLQITTSGLNSHDKKLIMKLVNANGGDFSRVFLSQTTDVLVLSKGTTGSDKHKAAIEFGKVCVTPDWVKDSAALGFALPASRYKVASATTSSPMVDRQVPDLSLNITRITREGKPSNFVDETKMADSIMLSGSGKFFQAPKEDVDEVQKAFEALDVANIKKAGPIFDGFCIWVSGLDGVARERAWACVSRAGGVRYDGPHTRVTHAVSHGAAALAAAAALPAVPVLSPLWLLRSVQAGRALDEAEYVIPSAPATPRKAGGARVSAASPMSKRSLQLLQPPRHAPATHEPRADHIVDQYLSQHLSQAAEPVKSPEKIDKPEPVNNHDSTAATVSECTQSENIFKDLIFEVQGLEDEAICEIGAEIREEGGLLVAAGAGGSHVLVPLDFDASQLVTKTADAVTVFWVKDCLSRQALAPIEYYHRPVRLENVSEAPLRGVVASLSTYTGVERAFLDELAKLCGATMQQRFCRRSNNSALASTHLVCPEAGGAKYAAAVKWGVPAVRAGWLLACARSGRRVSETEYALHTPEATTTGPPSPKLQKTLVNAEPLEPENKTLGSRSETPEPRSKTVEPRSETPVPRSKTPEPRSKTLEPRSETPVPRSKTLEPRSETPEPSCKTPEPRSKTLEPRSETPEPRSKTPVPAEETSDLPNEDLVANIEPDIEPRMPPDNAPGGTFPRNTAKKFKMFNMKNEMSPASRFVAIRRMGIFSDTQDSSKENTPVKPGPEDSDTGDRSRSIQTPTNEEVVSSSNLQGATPDMRRKLQASQLADEPVKTPVNLSGDHNRSIQTPTIEEALSSSNLQGFSPDTRRKLQAIRRGEIPDEPIKTPDHPFEKKIETPDSGFGAALRPATRRMSIDARKLLWEFINELPTKSPRRQDDFETPPTKIAKLTADQSAGGSTMAPAHRSEPEVTPARAGGAVPAEVDEQLQRLSVVLTGRRTPRRASRLALQTDKPDVEYESGPESQPNTVGWDDTTPSQKDSFESIAKPRNLDTAPIAELEKQPTVKQTSIADVKQMPKQSKDELHAQKKGNSSKIDEITDVSDSEMKAIEIACVQTEAKQDQVQAMAVKRFMLSSNVDNREETAEMILRLGGEVTDLDEEEDATSPQATHLLCCAPTRSQRVLNCIASGCWVLHPAYIARSTAAGAFLPEEAFEWGNPLAVCLPPVSGGERVLAVAAHRWRARKQRGQTGPFAGVRALLHAPEARRRLLARLVKAGEGTVIDEQPPYTDESINVCFADPKRYPMKERDRAWLVSRGVPVCASILLSAYITDENRPDMNQHCLPEFKP